jgi:hypothetical protein
MVVEPFEVDHLSRLQVQPHQTGWHRALIGTDWSVLAQAPNQAWAAVDEARTLGCAGYVDMGGGRARAWALLSGDLGPAMTAITRAVRRGLDLAEFRRVDAEVVANFQPGRRWASMLGFKFEGVMRAYCDDGEDAELWARVK